MHIWFFSLQGSSPSLGNDGQPLRLSITLTRPHAQANTPGMPAPLKRPAPTVTPAKARHKPANVIAAVKKNVPDRAEHTAPTIRPVTGHNSTTPDVAHTTATINKSEHSTTAETESSVSQQAQLLAQKRRIQSQLQHALQPHFYYPTMAVRRGWQGAVRLGLHIQSNGALLNIRVVSSSGHGILDRAAIDSLQQVKYLPAAVAILNGKDLEVILPVSFKLL